MLNFAAFNITDWEMRRSKEILNEKLNLEDTDSTLNNMVDVRACYKPNGKVRINVYYFTSNNMALILITNSVE